MGLGQSWRRAQAEMGRGGTRGLSRPRSCGRRRAAAWGDRGGTGTLFLHDFSRPPARGGERSCSRREWSWHSRQGADAGGHGAGSRAQLHGARPGPRRGAAGSEWERSHGRGASGRARAGHTPAAGCSQTASPPPARSGPPGTAGTAAVGEAQGCPLGVPAPPPHPRSPAGPSGSALVTVASGDSRRPGALR